MYPITAMKRVWGWGYVILAAAWAAWIVALPPALNQFPSSRVVAAAGALTYRAAGLVCHQDPARSYRTGRWPVPVCARCTGLYLGGALGAVIGAASARRAWRTRRRPEFDIHRVRWVLILAALPTGTLWLAERAAGFAVSNTARAAGGVPFGMAVSWLVTVALFGAVLKHRLEASGVH